MNHTLSSSAARHAASFFADREYFQQLLRFAIPIATQNLLMSSLNLVSVMMIGQLGETAVAAVGLANQMFFLLQLVLFGVTSGSAIFTAQLWGKQDLPNIRKVLSLTMSIGLAASLVFLGLAQFAPQFVLGIYSTDPAVIAAGSQYLHTFGWSFVFVAVTFSFAAVLRSVGDVRTPMLVSISALVLNAILSYTLIFGKFGLPELGINGAALAALSARLVECSVLLFIVYTRRTLIAIRLSDLLSLDLGFIGRVFKPILPVILNETFWAMGISAYNVVYARMGTDSIATMNIVAPIDQMAFVFISGIANATAIMIGNRIGAGEEARAYRFAGRSLVIAMLTGLLLGGLVQIAAPYVLSIYKVDPQVIANARQVLVFIGLFMFVRAANSTIVVGILRSGGDTRFSFFLDGLIIWFVGVPMAYASAFIFDLPVYWVYVAVMSEEFAKCFFGMRRYFSKKWIHNLAMTVSEKGILASTDVTKQDAERPESVST